MENLDANLCIHFCRVVLDARILDARQLVGSFWMHGFWMHSNSSSRFGCTDFGCTTACRVVLDARFWMQIFASVFVESIFRMQNRMHRICRVVLDARFWMQIFASIFVESIFWMQNRMHRICRVVLDANVYRSSTPPGGGLCSAGLRLLLGLELWAQGCAAVRIKIQINAAVGRYQPISVDEGLASLLEVVSARLGFGCFWVWSCGLRDVPQ